MIEDGKAWPKQMNVARAAFLPKGETNSQDPLEYRVLLMLPGVYRMYTKTRLRHLAPWVNEWQLEGMFAGVEGKRGSGRSLQHRPTDRTLQNPRRRFCRSGGRHLQVFRSNPKTIALRHSGKGGHARRDTPGIHKLPGDDDSPKQCGRGLGK